MVPFRSSRSRSQIFNNDNNPNRTRTGQIDHDVFEGLPVRRWARQPTTVSQISKSESLEGSLLASQKLPELPMPKDSHLLTPVSRALLRAARAGCTYIGAGPKGEDEGAKDVKVGDDTDRVPVYERTFVSSKWGAIPRNIEPPELEFLAKRRPGLPSLYGAAQNDTAEGGIIQPQGQPTPMRKTKFKKADPATGIVSIYDAWVPEGQTVEGEVGRNEDVKMENDGSSDTVVAASPAPGTVVEGVGVVDQDGVVVVEADANVAAPVRRKPPPPKRKAKGPGRGRKKKVMFAAGEASEAGGASTAAGSVPAGQGPEQSEANKNQESLQEGEEDDDEEDDEEAEGEDSEGDEASGIERKPPGPSAVSGDQTGDTPAITVTTDTDQIPREETMAEPEAPGLAPPPRDLSTSPDARAADSRDADIPTSAPEPPPLSLQPESMQTTSEQQSVEASGDVPGAGNMDVDVQNVTQSAVVDHQTPTDADADPSAVAESPSTTLPHPPATSITAAPAAADATVSTATGPSPPAITTTADEPNSPSAAQDEAPQASSAPAAGPIHFEDGEVDLLGSLEASLDNRPADQQESREEPKPDEPQTEPDEVSKGEDDGETASS